MVRQNFKKLLFLIFLLQIHLVSAQYHIAERSLHYRPGDWVSYGVMRYVTSITLDYEVAYFGTTGGILPFDFFKFQWQTPITVSDGLESDHIKVIYYDFITGVLWCATEMGLSYRIPGAEQWRNITYCSKSESLECVELDPVSEFGRGKDFLWIRTVTGRTYQTDGILIHFMEAQPEDENRDGVQWASEKGKNTNYPHFFMEDGYLFNPEGIIEDPDFFQYSITRTLRDEYNHLFVGTHGLGGGVADTRSTLLKLYPFGLFIGDVQTMAWDEEGMWVGGIQSSHESGGLTWWDMTAETWRYFKAQTLSQMRSDRITDIIPDGRYVWFGTDDGLMRYDKHTDSWRSYGVHNNLWNNRITTLALTEGVLWVGTESGINWIDLDAMVIHKINEKPLVHRWIYKIESDGETIWAGTDRGLFRRTNNKKEWIYEAGYLHLVSLDVTAISAFHDEVWAARSDGVEVYHKMDKSWSGFSADQYPTEGPYHVILADSHVVWFGTDHGVLKYIKDEDRWKRYTTEDGLRDNSIRWMLLDGDYIWFGTGRGMTRFYWNAPYRID